MLNRAGLVLVAGVLVSACGGGGGGGAGDVTFSVSTNQIVKSDTIADYTQPQGVLTANLSGNAGQVYIAFQQTQNAIGTVYFDSYSPTSATVYVPFKQFMEPGIYEDTVVIHVCHDAACNKPLDGSPQTIAVTYNHLEGGDFSSTPEAIEVTAIQGVTPDVPAIDLAYSGGGVESWTAVVNYESGSDWLSIDNVGGPADFLPQYVNPAITPNLAPGTYQASILFTSNGGTVTHVVPVTYHVAEPRSNPTTMAFTADVGSTPETLTLPLGLLATFDDAGAGASAWTATADVPWLQVTPAAGESFAGASISVAVIPEALPQLDYGEHHATISVQGESGISELQVPVTLSVLLPRVQYAAPYVIAPGSPRDLILRGHGFAAADGLTLKIGDTVVSDYTVVDDTRIELQAPALAAGTLGVNLLDQFGGNADQGRVIVRAAVPAGQYPVQTLSVGSDGRVDQTVFDHGRMARFHVVYYKPGYYEPGSWRLVAERFDGTQWTNEYVDISERKWIALTPDGRELLALGYGGPIQHWDPDTLEVVATSSLAERDPYLLGAGPIFNDGRLLSFGRDPQVCGCCGCAAEIDETARWYDLRTHRFQSIPPNTVMRGSARQTPTLDNALVFGATEMRLIDPQFNVLASTPATGSAYDGILSMGEAPERLITVNNGMWTLAGASISWQTVSIYAEDAKLMAPDDQHAYYFVANAQKIRKRDMTQPDFPLVGEVAVPFNYWYQGMLSHDGSHLYHWGAQFTSTELP